MTGLLGSTAQPALGNSGKVIPDEAARGAGPPSSGADPTLGRYDLRDAAQVDLWRRAGLDEFRSLRLCGRSAIPSSRPDVAGVQLRRSAEGRHALTGQTSCGNTRLCPVCAPRIARKRADEIRRYTTAAFEAQIRVAFFTATLRHKLNQGPAQQLAAVRASFKKVNQGGHWDRAQKLHGVLGTIRSIEVQLLGPAGAHTHLHGLIFFAAGTSDESIRTVMEGCGRRWAAGAAAVMDGLRPSDAHGWQWEIVEDATAAGDYVAKPAVAELAWSPADEVARADRKRGRGGSVSPLQLLAMVMSDHDEHHEAVLIDYARAMKGSQTIIVSKGVKKALGITEERSDEELAAEPEDGVATWEVVAEFTPGSWTAIVRAVGIGGVLRAAAGMGSECVPYLLAAAAAGRRRRAA